MHRTESVRLAGSLRPLAQALLFGCIWLFGNTAIVLADAPYVVVLGVAQDAGYPQASCTKLCCKPAWENASQRRWVSCLGIIDPESGQRWMLDCTPDFRDQLRLLDEVAPVQSPGTLSGVLPTHAHIGHYTGLMHLGREAMGAKQVPVMVMPRMKYFLETSGPWSQLVKLEQIKLIRISDGQPFQLNERLTVTPFVVPHRDEYSETVGFEIQGPNRSVVYLPDIDKWERWDRKIEDLIRRVDIAFLDGTFFDGDELPGRDMSEIPHPFVQESVMRFRQLPRSEREKIRFTHLNHTNPLLRGLKERGLEELGMKVAIQANSVEINSTKANSTKADSVKNTALSAKSAQRQGIHTL